MKLRDIIIYLWIAGLIALPVFLAHAEKPEPYTELYFNEPLELENKAREFHTIAFSFTIKNNGEKDVAYPYLITMYKENTTSILREDTAEVPKDSAAAIPHLIRLNETLDDVKVSVMLQNTGQEIHFWMKKNMSELWESHDQPPGPGYDPDFLNWEWQDPLVKTGVRYN